MPREGGWSESRSTNTRKIPVRNGKEIGAPGQVAVLYPTNAQGRVARSGQTALPPSNRSVWPRASAPAVIGIALTLEIATQNRL